jgi:N utilization substance protein B
VTEDTKKKPQGKTRRRTLGRELAVKVLYQLDLMRLPADTPFEDLASSQETDPDAIEFARSLVLGVKGNQRSLDEAITKAARNWDLSRMAVVDRNILRIAALEILTVKETPAKVAINEAVELAKKYSTGGSGAFVNGVLDEIRKRSASAPPPEQEKASGSTPVPSA